LENSNKLKGEKRIDKDKNEKVKIKKAEMNLDIFFVF
jgi:hypothetical protein